MSLAKSTIIEQGDIADIMLKYRSKISHVPVFRRIEPPNWPQTLGNLAQLTDEELQVGLPTPPVLRKAMNTIQQMRQTAGHLFWIPAIKEAWWIVSFSDLDLVRRHNHWKGGSHVHLLCHLTHPRSDPEEFLLAMKTMARPELPHALHVRFHMREGEAPDD